MSWAYALLCFLGALGAVFGTGLVALGYAGCVQGATDDVVAHTGEIPYAAAAD
jgi:hypothetical protein